MAKKAKYDESSISYFKTDLEKVRAKPHMYIGPTDDDGVFTIAREVLDNAIDEARAGRNDLVHFVFTGRDYWVLDNGIGIPVKQHPQAKISTLTHVLTALQSSGKMKGDAYTSSIGTHGVGIKATNALSASFEVWTYRKDAGGWHYTKFEGGVEKVKPKKAKPPTMPDGTKPKKGTLVRWTHDPKIFGKAQFQDERVETWGELTAYMNAGTKIVFHDMSHLHMKSKKKAPKVYYSKHGIKEYLQKRMDGMKANPFSKKIIDHHSKHLEVCVAFSDADGDYMEFFTNTVRNKDKGFHADSFYKALFDSLKPYQGRLEYTPTDLREGLVGVLNIKIDAPKFSGQTKEKNVDERAQKPCYDECMTVLKEYWASNKTFAKEVATRAAELRKKTADFLKDKKLSRNVKLAQKGLTTKLAGVQGNRPISEREIYLVEGDSAGGTAKLARFKDFQAVFSLKGKPLNVMEAGKDKVNSNKEIAGLMAGIGIDPGAKNPLDKVQFGRIIFLADPDVDGRHINALLGGMFWKYLPSLYREGRIFMLRAPEFMAKKGDKFYFGDTKEEVWKKAGTDKIPLRHIKGWGEIKEDPMRAIAFDPAARRLIRLVPPESKAGGNNIVQLLGKDATYRKRMLGLLDKPGKKKIKEAA